MNIVFLLTGLLVVFGLAYLVSNNRRGIRYRPLLMMLAVQLALGFFLLNTKIGINFITELGKMFFQIMEWGKEGVYWVFGGLKNEGAGVFSFFFDVLMPIIFISVLIGILNYLRILPILIRYIGLALNKLNGMGRLENYIAVSSAILGQSEVFLTVKKPLGMVSRHRLYTLCTSAMSAVSIALVAAYMEFIQPKYVVIAIVINILSALIVANIINPYELHEEEDILITEEKHSTLFQTISESIIDGLKVAVIVAAMLVGFIALINMINWILVALIGLKFQAILGYVFSPIAFLMGVPYHEAVRAGSVMATKLVTNEFIAMTDFKTIAGQLSSKTVGIVSVFLISFANFSSIGIVIGAVKALQPDQGEEVARFGLKLLYGSTLASILSGTIIGLFL